MKSKSALMIAILTLSSLVIFSGCFLQPKATTVQRWNMIEVENAPALRIGKPVKASFFDWALNREVTVELLEKSESGEWVSIGKGTLPAGAYIKGQRPKNLEAAK
jgi:hypothetical protein